MSPKQDLMAKPYQFRYGVTWLPGRSIETWFTRPSSVSTAPSPPSKPSQRVAQRSRCASWLPAGALISVAYGIYHVPDAPGSPFDQVAEALQPEHVDCRRLVRRVKRIQPQAGVGTAQELFAAYRNPTYITNSTLEVIEADKRIVTTRSSSKSSPHPRTPPGGSTVRELRGKRGPAGAHHHRIQPRQGGRGRRPDPHRTRGGGMRRAHQPACPDRVHRPPSGHAPTYPVAWESVWNSLWATTTTGPPPAIAT